MVNLKLWKKQLDEILAQETLETMASWLKERRSRNNVNKLRESNNDMNTEDIFYFLDEADEGYYFIKSTAGDIFTAGYDYHKVKNVIKKLNNSHDTIIVQNGRHSIQVCWDSSDGENNCKFEQVI